MANTEETTKANLPQKTPQTNLRSMDSSSNQYGKESWDFKHKNLHPVDTLYHSKSLMTMPFENYLFQSLVAENKVPPALKTELLARNSIDVYD